MLPQKRTKWRTAGCPRCRRKIESPGLQDRRVPSKILPLAHAMIHALVTAILQCWAAADEDMEARLAELQELADRTLTVHQRRVLVVAIQQLEAALAPPQQQEGSHGT